MVGNRAYASMPYFCSGLEVPNAIVPGAVCTMRYPDLDVTYPQHRRHEQIQKRMPELNPQGFSFQGRARF